MPFLPLLSSKMLVFIITSHRLQLWGRGYNIFCLLPLSFLDLPYCHLRSIHAFTRFALSSLHINSCIHHFNPCLSTTSFSWLLDHRFGRSSFIITLYWRSRMGMFCRNLYFLVQVQSRWVEISRKLVATLIFNKECSISTSKLFKVSFFLVHLFYPFSFALIHSIKWIGNSTIISFSFFCEFDVSSTCCWILVRLDQCSQTRTGQILGWIGTWQTWRLW